MFNYIAIANNIKRSELAYRAYCENKNYHHALHIFYANETIYDELNALLKEQELSAKLLEITANYLFHLEDWFLQFLILEIEINGPEQDFLFSALESNVPYPSDFLETINK